MQYSAYKRLIRKAEQDPALGPQSHHAVTYVENFAYLLLLSKAICLNVQNLSCPQIMSLQTKLIGCANPVAKYVTVWLALLVSYEHIQFTGVERERGEDMR